MMPIGPLMIEHRLIERMVGVLREEMHSIKEKNQVHVERIDSGVDFFRTYADQCHHGKEEDILFRDLAKKRLSPEHKKIMDELIQEHVFGRETVGRLSGAKERYGKGDTAALNEIIGILEKLVEFYPIHIAKEDQRFFMPCMEYFGKGERDAMLQECWEFDKKLIHEKYRQLVERFEGKR
ncbi:MAG TPA: hemerythrin domain-containing protein [Thermodesulfobacteriota bacterium]